MLPLIRFQTTAAALVVAVVFSCLGCGRGEETPELYHHRGEIFGTTYTVTFADWHLHSEADQAAAIDRIQSELEEVDRYLSTYQPDSDLSRFNRARDPKAVQLSYVSELCLQTAWTVVDDSKGAFDPTVGPAVRAWGFGWDRPTGSRAITPPSAEEIDAIRANIGWDQLRWIDEDHSKPASIASDNPNLEIDASAIAKGLAVDLVWQGLAQLGFEHFMVEVGGEVRVQGERPGGGPWRLWVESPVAERPELACALELPAGKSLATSGDYRNFRVLSDGRTVSHTIDPRTGEPVVSPPLSVSVLGASCDLADAWATALCVAGEAGLAWIEARPSFEARMVLRPTEEDGAPRIVTTSGWPADPRQAGQIGETDAQSR